MRLKTRAPELKRTSPAGSINDKMQAAYGLGISLRILGDVITRSTYRESELEPCGRWRKRIILTLRED